jgi:hypothetical protein
VHPVKYHALAESIEAAFADHGGEPVDFRGELQVMLSYHGEVFRFFSSDAILDPTVDGQVERLAQIRRDLGENITLAAQLIGEVRQQRAGAVTIAASPKR